MRNTVAALATMFFSMAAATADTPSGAPIEAYGALPTLSDVTITPDGKTFAYVRGSEGQRYIMIHPVGASKPISMTDIGDAKLRGLEWVDDTHLLILTSTTGVPLGYVGRRSELEAAQWYDLSTHSFHPLFQKDTGIATGVISFNMVLGKPMVRFAGGHVLVFVRGMYLHRGFLHGESMSRLGLFRFDLTEHTAAMVSRAGDDHAENWIVDDQGNIVAEADYYERDQTWQLKLYHGLAPFFTKDFPASIEGPQIEGFNEDGTAIVMRLPKDEGWPAYEQVSLKDGTAAPWRADLQLGGLMAERTTERVIGGPRFSDKSDYMFFDPHTDMVWRSIKAAFANATDVDLVSWSQDHSKVVVLVFGPNYGDAYFYIDMTTHKAVPLGPAYDGVTAVSQRTWIDYKAADGRLIHAYLTLPMNRDPKNLPLVVLPHGGPYSRDEPGFDWLSQAIASRGYVVLQPQFRGSKGFGKDLLWAGFGEMGKKMQTDLSDGVRALAAQGLIDAKRVCIVGWSYGGYAALAGATLDTGVYRCVVSYGGLSDIGALTSDMHWPHHWLDDRGERYWDRYLDISGPGDPKLDAISPIKHIDNVSVPILLMHGRDDTVVKFSQSEDMAEALKAADKPYEFLELKGADHWLLKGDTRLQMLTATVKFLEANNPPN